MKAIAVAGMTTAYNNFVMVNDSFSKSVSVMSNANVRF